ncbi:hypothetical protein SH661x_001905 [Planctomicrobium sp. SH661]|uniref:hypothetical protein n=1 Tax=Planctomicrobium sp. SH661 TaxID=3448124 RepID=UPI003F5BCA60
MKYLFILVTVLFLGGCAKEEHQPTETDYQQLGTTKEESDQLRNQLQSTTVEEVLAGLKQIEKKPQLIYIHRDQVMSLNQTSQDPKVQKLTEDILARSRL